jgi:predicted transcriptional regulator
LSDVLQYLRTRDNKYLDGNRRNYGNQSNKSTERRQYDKRKHQDQVDPTESEIIERLFSEKDSLFKTFLEVTTERQKRQCEAEEKLAAIEDRKADAMHRIAAVLKQLQSDPKPV